MRACTSCTVCRSGETRRSFWNAPREAESGHDLEKAEQSLRQYLNFRREDAPAWEFYARVVDERDVDRRNRERVLLIHEEALGYNAGDRKLERSRADIALELQRFGDAKRHLKKLLDSSTTNTSAQPAASELAEIEDLLGRCGPWTNPIRRRREMVLEGPRARPEPRRLLRSAGADARGELRRIEAADGLIKEMVAKNPKTGHDFIYRWRYSQEFLKGPDANDLQKALALAPDDPEVLFTAAVVSEQKQDVASARVYFDKGTKLDPKRADFRFGTGSTGNARRPPRSRRGRFAARVRGDSYHQHGLQLGGNSDSARQDRG